MAVASFNNLEMYCLDVAARAKAASDALAQATGLQKETWLRQSAKAIRERQQEILAANDLDLDNAASFGLTAAQIDRLKLNPQRIESIAEGLEQVANLPEPVGEVIESSVRPNGLQVLKVRVPLGPIFFIYESRPNVTADAAAICIKSGNPVILRGGKEAAHSSKALVKILAELLVENGLPQDALHLVATTDRAAVGHFLALDDYIAVAIPRGGESLIRRVAAEAKMPVIKHFNGNCHVYIDRTANLDMAEAIVVNSKCHRLGVCNAAESLLIHADVAQSHLPPIAAALMARNIEIRGDERVRALVPQAVAATEEDYSAEYLDAIISANVVDSLDEAILRINRYGSHHTDAIVTESLAAAREFTVRVDSAAVMVNASTRFNDGGQFGLGAEIGISTDKLHARGPCGLKELTSYKYVVHGSGQVRP